MRSEATELMEAVVQEYKQGYGFGSMSTNIYDTAWIACVSKHRGSDLRQWLFPSSFLFILRSQHIDGGWHWPSSGADECHHGTLLSSLAALFAITQHLKTPLQLFRFHDEARSKLARGMDFLGQRLSCLETVADYSVGFELLVSNLLQLLDGEGIKLSFPQRTTFNRKKEEKLSTISVTEFGKGSSTMLHSLEAFYGDKKVPFDVLRGRLVQGSVMASPSATAAYLMTCSDWDDAAEAYLHLVISNGVGQNSGSAPSAFPSSNFELTWVASTLLKAGCIRSDMCLENESLMFDIFERQMPENGLVGFAQGIQPDVDDSAKTSIVLSLLGRPGLCHRIRESFETETHFETYRCESMASLSANCNTLLALLLDLKNDPGAAPAIAKVSMYLANAWLDADGPIKDKWNISEYYPTMLLAQAFVKLIRSWEADELSTLDNQLLRDQVLLVSFRSLSRILHAQDNDGSWGSKGPCEESAYAILALVELSCLPIATLLEEQVQTAITNGRTYLESQRKSGPAEFLWVEKVVYRAQHISEAYIIAALNVSAPAPLDGKKLRSLVGIDTDEVKNSVRLLRKVPLLVAQPEWSLVASLIESRLFLFKVQEMRHSVFSRTGLSKDKYLAWIPFIWSLANNKHQGCLSTRVLSDMMHVSVLNFQVDEFMETIVTALDRVDLPKVHDILEELFESINFLDDGSDQVSRPERTQRGTQAGDRADEGIVRPNTAATSHHERRLAVANAIQAQQYGDNRRAAALSTVADRLGAYITFVSRLATKAGVRPSSLSRTLIELKAFLHAHVTQCQLNQELGIKKQAAAPSDGPLVYDSLLTSSFRHWLHLIAAVHTSCPYSFELYLGLAGAAHKMPLLKTPRQRYMATDLCGHLARMCRLYNDEGSLQRDEQEGNLNCVNFVELRGEWEDTQSPGPAARLIYENDAGVTANASGKRNLGGELMTLAELERKNLMSALKGLGEMTETEVDVMNRLEVFVDVTDLFGQIYVIKDLASRRIRDSKDL